MLVHSFIQLKDPLFQPFLRVLNLFTALNITTTKYLLIYLYAFWKGVIRI